MHRERISFSELSDASRENWPEAAAGNSLLAPAIYRLHEHLSRLAEALFKEYDLQSAEFETLCALRNSPPPHCLTPTDIYRMLLISSGGMTKILTRLEKRGLVGRPANPKDARSRMVGLSVHGKMVVEGITERLLKAERRLLECCPQPDVLEQQLTEWLTRIEQD
ncbi:MarR family winged helix-turn-helix transcriptional regulator [Marinobacterium weihaiense]|uniref:MarR family transcriptional regulator n=1 Tax=Marinobacterium weihaiense TaxID=2851016 RepID=A0ABS6M8N2_9GAMM|nr:MarR family transcriptional regulator [Marinobacterium weihaiense]MBV0932646.1 MarR family transcriptional regulator [Marinobacterium weihaiense]